MISAVKNSALVLIFAFLMGLPVMGFGFIGYDDKRESLQVLGTCTSHLNKCEDKDLQMVDQIDLELNVAEGFGEKLFYNVVPVEYEGDGHKVYLILSEKAKNAGIEAELVQNESTAYIKLNAPDEILPAVVELHLVVFK